MQAPGLPSFEESRWGRDYPQEGRRERFRCRPVSGKMLIGWGRPFRPESQKLRSEDCVKVITCPGGVIVWVSKGIPHGDGGGVDGNNDGSVEVHHHCLWQIGLLQLLLFFLCWAFLAMELKSSSHLGSWVLMEPNKWKDYPCVDRGVTQGDLGVCVLPEIHNHLVVAGCLPFWSIRTNLLPWCI